MIFFFFCSSRRRHTRCALVTGVQTCALPISHLVRAAKMAVWGQTDAGHGCPISMTYAVIPALRHNADLAAQYEPLLTTRHYDSALKAPQIGRASCRERVCQYV